MDVDLGHGKIAQGDLELGIADSLAALLEGCDLDGDWGLGFRVQGLGFRV